MTTPSPRVEALLYALGADAPYRDAILGDLAEEFAIRVEEQGSGEARRWYRRQAIRTAPHLLRQWAMRLSSFDVCHLIALTLIGEVVISLCGLAIRAAIVASYGVATDNVSIVNAAWRSLVAAGAIPANAILLASATTSVFFGYGLGRFVRRAPLATSIVVGFGLSLPAVVGAAFAGGPPSWLRVGFVAIAAAGTIVGCALASTLRRPVLDGVAINSD
jgi:hypothetical protein